MGNASRFLGLVLLIVTVGVLAASTPAEAAYDDEEGILVGRIAHVEGKLLRYIEEENDWVVTVKDSPFGLEDALYSGDDAKAEFIMPNRTWLRVGENTQIQLIALNPDATTVDVASGLARFYNKSDDTVIKVTTPFGYVVALGDTVFDLYVGDESLEVIAVRGDVDFVHYGSDARYEIREGSFSIIADQNETAMDNGTVDSDWDDWNEERDILWAKRLRTRSYSDDYLPEPIRDEAYALDQNGRWESVYYEGDYREMWRPTRVDRGWRPFTVGRWTVYYGDQCWVPDEPFGYVTHHYGSWVYIKSSRYWYWVPPVTRIATGAPVFSIGFGWYPGRVGWIHSGPSIGWVPLAPHETYYGYRPWGHRTVIYNKTTVFNINIVNYRYLDEAVVIDRDHFYRGRSYTPHIQRVVSRDILINNYRPTTVINNTVINNFNIDKRRYTYNDVEVSRKPHTMVIDRINDNRKMRRDSGRFNRERIEKDLTRLNVAAEPQSRREFRKPTLANKLVDADKVDKPLDTLFLEKKEIKRKDRERQVFDKDRRRGEKGQDEFGQVRREDSREEKRRPRFPGDAQDREVERGVAEESPQWGEKQRRQQERAKFDQVDTDDKSGEKKQLRSPRDVQSPEARELSRKQEANQEGKEPKFRRQQQEEEKGQRQPEQEMKQRRTEEFEKRPAQPQSPKFKKRDQQEETQQEAQGRQEQEPRLRKQKEDQNRQALELQQRKLKEDQGRLEQELQQRKLKEEQGRQEQELQRWKQKEEQGRQEQELQRRKLKEEQGRQEQELQRRKLKEEQGRQEQESQRWKQKEEQGRQEQELQRRKLKEEQGRQEQESQRWKQKEEQGRKEQELQRRQQDENQFRQKQEKQRQQPEEVKKPQEKQGLKKKKKEEEEAAAAAGAAFPAK